MGGSTSSPDHEAKLLDEYQVKLYALDDAAFGLFNAVDQMDAVASLLEQELQADIGCTDQKKTESHLEQIRKLAARLLTTSKGALLHQKRLANVSLNSFLNFIKERIIRNVGSVEGTFKMLSVESYENGRNLLDSKNKRNAFEAQLDILEEKNNEIKSFKDRIETFKRRETTFVKEENLQREQIQHLKKISSEELEKRKIETDEVINANITLKSQLQRASAYETKYHNQMEELQCLEKEKQQKKADYENSLAEMEEIIQNLNNENEDLKKRVEDLQRAYGNLEKEYQQKLADYESAEKEHQQKLAGFENSLAEKEKIIRNLDNANEEHKTNVENLQRAFESAEKEHQQKLAGFENSLAEKDKIIQNLHIEHEKYKKCLEDLQCTHENLEKGKKILENDLENLRSFDESQTAEIVAFKKVNSDLEHKLEEKENILQQITEKYTTSKNLFETKKSKYKGEKENLKSEISDLKEKIKEKDKQRCHMEKEKDNTIAQYEIRLENLNQKVESLSFEKELRLKSDEELKQTKKYFEDNLQELKDKHADELKKSNNEFSEMVSKYNSETKKLKSLHLGSQKELENKILQANQEVNKLNRELQELNRNCKTEIENKDKLVEYLKSENKSLNEKLVKLQRNFESLTREKDEYIRNLEKEKRTLNATISEERKSVQNLKLVLKEKEATVQSQEKEKNNLLAKLNDERDNLQKIHIELSSKNTELTELKRQSMKRYKEFEKDLEHQLRKSDSLKKELDLIKAKKRVPVQLYTQKRSELTDNVGETIISLLQKEFVSDHLELDFWKCSRISDIHQDYPLLVICITVSRIGTDVANAIHGISLSHNMAVMVFHHKDEHALPNQLSERILTGKELKDIGGIFDMAYFSGKGIYHCEMNRNSADSLVTFIKRVARNIHP